MMMVGVAALSLATTALAQWGNERTYSHQLQVQIDSGVRQGTISRVESVELREDLGRLVRLERQFSPSGISGHEHATLLQHSISLAKDIRIAIRDPNRRGDSSVSWDGCDSHGNASYRNYADPRFAGPHLGDRFIDDIRIGQRATARIGHLPVQYRDDYVDNEQIYYGYDNGRVYQIDRQSRTILALLDIAR
jgi:hypothetical protein